MSKRTELLKILAGGGFHSGQALGDRLGISRAAVWKHIKAFEEWQLDCYSVSGKGYRLARPLELLDGDQIRAALGEAGCHTLGHLELHTQIHSTNHHLMERIGQGLVNGQVCLAEYQTGGRGRRGRQWQSPFGRNIYLSFYWKFQQPPAVLGTLGLALAVAILRALQQLGVEGASLKWPNDILWHSRKLAGVLLEMKGEAEGPYHVVSGVGLNVDMGEAGGGIDQPWTDLNQITDRPLSRNVVAAALIEQLLIAAAEFDRDGLAPFIEEWRQADAFADRDIVVHLPNEAITGRARGIAADGALQLETDSGLRSFHSGEVSVRAIG